MLDEAKELNQLADAWLKKANELPKDTYRNTIQTVKKKFKYSRAQLTKNIGSVSPTGWQNIWNRRTRRFTFYKAGQFAKGVECIILLGDKEGNLYECEYPELDTSGVGMSKHKIKHMLEKMGDRYEEEESAETWWE